jgi:DNA-binding MarR family transcriptional regulator
MTFLVIGHCPGSGEVETFKLGTAQADETAVEEPRDVTDEAEPADRISVAEATEVAELRSALRRFLHRSERIARESGLTPQRHLLLLLIKGARDGSETSTVTELTERLQLAQSTVTELVDRAVAAGLIERRRSPDDQRVFELRLAPEGERRLAQSFRSHDEERARLIDTLSDYGFLADG